jgi:citrate lyase subunit alpha/citrate CoA-transferase
MMKNVIGVDVPNYIEGIGVLEPFQGAWAKLGQGWMDESQAVRPVKAKMPHADKRVPSLVEAIAKCEPRNGMTVSFHHHLRSGDSAVIETLDILHRMGIRDITLASSSLSSAHDVLLPYLQDGTVTRIWTSGIRDKLGEAITRGALEHPVMIHSHGGRVRAVKTGKISIDLAIIAASAADDEGNATGCHGPSAFGSIGYAMVDAEYARHVIVVTDNIVPYPCLPMSIKQTCVDYVVKIDSIGDPTKIATGTTRITKAPMDLFIAEMAARVIEHSGFMEPGFSFQVGAGGASLAVAKFMRETMRKRDIKGGFALGGVTSYIVDMLNEGLFETIFDVQSFDAAVSSSLVNNPRHVEISCDQYANPYNCGCMTNKLDVVVLGALEVEEDFNVNVITGSEGFIRGASGGHCDTASGANLTVVVCPSFRGRNPILKRTAHNVVTPGETVDVIVTERGVCVNPAKEDLRLRLAKAGLPVRDIQDLHREVDTFTGVPDPIHLSDKIVGLVEYRDGTIIDIIRQVVE